MPPPSSKTLSPAELAKLEHAFATDPASEAYRPLAEAYLGMGRFMEAMVVCKKGVKAHPNLATPRVLLARVYADQGKDRKALEELQAALQVSPKDKSALRMSGVLHMKLGEADTGRSFLLQAFESDPADEETLAALTSWKVDAPVKASAANPGGGNGAAARSGMNGTARAPIAGPGTARPGSMEGVPGKVSGVLSPVQIPSEQVTSHGQHVRGGSPSVEVSPEITNRPVQRTRPRTSQVFDDVDPEELIRQEAREVAERRNKHAGKARVFMGLLIVGVLAVASYAVFDRMGEGKKRERDKYLTEVQRQLAHDSYDSYQKASVAAEKALDVDPESAYAHAYLAYASVIRWGEHGAPDDVRRQAEEHLALARQYSEGKGDAAYVTATEALLQSYSGKGAQARKALEATVKEAEAKKQANALLYLTLGILQMNLGDLDASHESLKKAASLQNDPRIFSAMGTLLRRRGQEREAKMNFDFALKYEKGHPESMLGKTLLILEQEEPNFTAAADMLKKLLETDPPPSPRQLATAYVARSFLISRVSRELPSYNDDYAKELSTKTGVPLDPNKARNEMLEAEQKGFSRDANNPELRLIKGRRLIGEGKFDEAVTEIRRAIEMDSSRALFFVELARALMSKPGGEKEASEALKKAIASMGESPRLVVMLGDAYRKLGRLDDALAQYNRAVSAPGSRNAEARLAIGRIYRERKDYAKATEALEKAVSEAIGQSSQVAAAYTELGRVSEEKGDRGSSEDLFQKAIRADESYSPSYCYYAKLLSQERKSQGRARTLAQEYLRRDPRGDCAGDAQRIAGD